MTIAWRTHVRRFEAVQGEADDFLVGVGRAAAAAADRAVRRSRLRDPRLRSGGEIIDRGQFSLVKAEDLRAARFPNTFLCRACGRFKTVRTGQQPPTCTTTAHGAMEQFPWAEVHESGHLAELKPPGCANNCRAPMELHNTTNLSRPLVLAVHQMQDPLRPSVTGWCGGCRSGRVQLPRLPQTLAYYPQQITVLNPPTRST